MRIPSLDEERKTTAASVARREFCISNTHISAAEAADSPKTLEELSHLLLTQRNNPHSQERTN